MRWSSNASASLRDESQGFTVHATSFFLQWCVGMARGRAFLPGRICGRRRVKSHDSSVRCGRRVRREERRRVPGEGIVKLEQGTVARVRESEKTAFGRFSANRSHVSPVGLVIDEPPAVSGRSGVGRESSLTDKLGADKHRSVRRQRSVAARRRADEGDTAHTNVRTSLEQGDRGSTRRPRTLPRCECAELLPSSLRYRVAACTAFGISRRRFLRTHRRSLVTLPTRSVGPRRSGPAVP